MIPLDAEEQGAESIATHSGFPNPAAERQGSPLDLNKLLIRHPISTFYFRVRGHSWHRYGVFDGDIAVIDRALSPKGRDLVVWWQESGEFALSSFLNCQQPSVWGTVTAIIHECQ